MHVAKTIRITTEMINIKASLLLIPTSIRRMLLGSGQGLSEFTIMRARSLFARIIWLKTNPTIVVWETNSGALSNASRYDVTDSSDSPAESGINMVVVSST